MESSHRRPSTINKAQSTWKRKSAGEAGPSSATPKKLGTSEKSEAVISYNKGKLGADLSLWKRVKWYRKLSIELLLRICIVNTHGVYQEMKGSKMKIRKFRDVVTLALLDLRRDPKRSS